MKDEIKITIFSYCENCNRKCFLAHGLRDKEYAQDFNKCPIGLTPRFKQVPNESIMTVAEYVRAIYKELEVKE